MRIVYDDYLPDFPRTRHLPWEPNASRDDVIATLDECRSIFSENVEVTEKVDGANVGIALVDGEPLIRNRNHILNKAHTARTAAKAQYSPLWNWFYENRSAFEKLGAHSVYGEWLLARHSIAYETLPSYFLAFDVFDQHDQKFLDPHIARSMLIEAGLPCVPVLHTGPLESAAHLSKLLNRQSAFAPDPAEGIYLKIGDGSHMVQRFKMVRPGFIAGEHWSKNKITKNTLSKKAS